MIKSMTAYGRGFASSETRSVDLEFKSVNSRYFDVNIRMPKSLIVLEDRIRKRLNSVISRGKLDLFINYRNTAAENIDISINMPLAENYVKSLREMASKLSLTDDISASFVSGLDDVIVTKDKEEDSEEVWKLILEALDIALINHKNMRETEGEALKKDILIKKDTINEKIEAIEKILPNTVPLYRAKLEERLNELSVKLFDEERIAQEVAIFADRSSIDEEVTRLKSHMNQLENILALDEPVGKKLDFLIQEMNREANTMASKSVDLELTSNVLEIKNEIEKIREQIQNIE